MKNTEEIKKNDAGKAYARAVSDFTVNGECSRCGGCCSQSIAMTDAERDAVMEYVKKNGIKPASRSAAGPFADFLCPFLHEGTDNKPSACAVYDVRPAICRVFRCDKSKERGAAEIAEILKCDPKELKQRNMGQEFFPDVFGIESGSAVVPLPIALVPDDVEPGQVYIAYDDPAGNPAMAVFVPAEVPDEKKRPLLRPKYEFQALQLGTGK